MTIKDMCVACPVKKAFFNWWLAKVFRPRNDYGVFSPAAGVWGCSCPFFGAVWFVCVVCITRFPFVLLHYILAVTDCSFKVFLCWTD